MNARDLNGQRLGTGVVRELVADVYARRPGLSDADVAVILGRKLGRSISGQVVGRHRRALGIPPGVRKDG